MKTAHRGCVGYLCVVVAFATDSIVPRTDLHADEVVDLSTSTGQEPRDRDHPLRIRPLEKPLFDLSPDDHAWVRQQIQPRDDSKLSLSYFLHILRAHGLDARFESARFPSGSSLLAPLLDAQAAREVFGEAALVSVRAGARFQSRLPMNTPGWREFHRDQNLSAFAELGLPRSTKLTIDNKAFSIADVLRDSVSNFHLKQEEIEWTALAYALYLPPVAAWANRYGEQYSFDDLAHELLNRPMVGSACGGTHLLYSLTMIARADQIIPILSADVRNSVRQRLRVCVRLAVVSQKHDGSWPGDWFLDSDFSNRYRGPSPVSTPQHQLAVTGHLAEWMLYLPADLLAPDTTLEQACSWLFTHLKQLQHDDRESQFCPCTHAICVLRRLGRSTTNNGTSKAGP